MSEPVSPDIPKVPQATSEPQQQAPVVEKIPWWKKPFVRNKTPEPPQQNPNSHVEPTTNDETVAFDKSALERTTAAMKTMYDKGETDHMQGLGDTNANPSSSTELIDMHGFYTPKEQAAITNTQPPRGFYEEIMASGTNAPNTLTQRPDDQPVLDSQGQPVTEYIAQNDPRYTDPKIPDYLKVGTPDYVIRQAQGGNYLNDTDELKRALAAKTFDNLTQAQQNVEAVANPIPEKGSIGFDAWEKLRTANTDLYKIKPKESNDTSEQKQVIWDAKRQE